ncbi:SPOR domain-containing protein [Lacinutrix iliipiscaria]|uniref:SPOR domain-containing protein n=1 Tax=Lacinutrix iliipiscaria TaxID=1230532 RepID=A0ABW5WIC6_9FLAO
MKLIKIKVASIIVMILSVFTSICYAQQGEITVNQDQKITELLKLKKEINSNEDSSDRYKIQIYSGRRISAEKSKSDFDSSYREWSSKMVYETPNYKVWVGSFRSRLEADRALLKIKKTFPNAFIFKPKKEKEN